MIFLHASQNEGQLDEVTNELATFYCQHHPDKREALLQFSHPLLAPPFLGVKWPRLLPLCSCSGVR